MNANKQDAGRLPPLPNAADLSPTCEFLYTADQMRAYGELCRAAPAGGDVAVGEICELNGTKLIVGRDEDALARLPKGTKLYTRPQDSAPAGAGEVDALVGRLYAAARHVDLASKKLPDAFNGWEARDIAEAAALLRKLQQGAE